MTVVSQPNVPEPLPVRVVAVRPSNRGFAPLPRPLTSLVDREQEVAALLGLLRDPAVRLLTLTGPGGVGKTRLAIAAAAAIAGEFSDGVVFVRLATLADPSLLGSTIAHALDMRDAGAEPPATRLAVFLGERQLLLVLDNFERVVATAPLLTDLLEACPDLKIIVTSRVRLRLSGEREYLVPPLTLPDPAGNVLAEDAAVALFAERARAVQPDFGVTPELAPTVVEICRRVDGLPLAIELAAARVKSLPPAALLDRLERRLPLLTGGGRDLPLRQQTMRDTIGWSYDLLTEDEQTLFRRLAVFAGGFTLSAAEYVGGEASPPDVFDGIASLIEQSLVQLGPRPSAVGTPSEPRYLILETIREYGLEGLEASGEEAAIRNRHAAWCLEIAQETWAILFRTYDPVVVERLEAELANLRAALGWLARTGQGDHLLRLAAATGPLWFMAGHFREGRDWLERALAASEASIPARAQALSLAGFLAHFLGDGAAAEDQLRRGAALARQLDLPVDEARAVINQGIVLQDRGDYEGAESHFAAALAMARQAGHYLWSVNATYHLGIVAYGRGEAERATRLWEEALAEARGHDDSIVASWCLQHLGLLAAEQGDLPRAATVLGECVALSQTVYHRRNRGALLATLAVLGSACGAIETAARLLGAAAAAANGELAPTPPEGIVYQRAAERLRQLLGATVYDRAVATGRSQGVEGDTADVDAVLASTVSDTTHPETSRYGLTPREREVLRLLVAGRTNPEIAAALFISPRTATTHVANILAKLDVATRTEAATLAVRDGLI